MPKPNKKSVILETATLLFAEKGYDATGMEEISATAGVQKSLIYYHFKNKEDLLNAIINGFLEEYSQLLHDSSVHGIDKISVYMDFLKRNRNCAKIILSESLKSGSQNTLIFKALGPLVEIDARNAPDETLGQEHWVAEFFTSIIPSILFVCYEENWCKYFHVNAEQLEKDYYRAYRLTHGAYHDHIDKESL